VFLLTSTWRKKNEKKKKKPHLGRFHDADWEKRGIPNGGRWGKRKKSGNCIEQKSPLGSGGRKKKRRKGEGRPKLGKRGSICTKIDIKKTTAPTISKGRNLPAD